MTLGAASGIVKYRPAAGGAEVTVSEGKTSQVEYLSHYGVHHGVALTGLKPATRYTYRVGNDESGWSQEASFTTAPGRKTDFSVSVFGDLGYEDSDQRPMVLSVDGLVKHWSATHTRNRLMKLRDEKAIDWIWHLGDIGYADDSFAHNPVSFDYEDAYSGYMNWMQNVSAGMAYMVSPGNHESECHSPNCIVDEKVVGKTSRARSLSNFSAFNARWRMPSAESGGHPNSAMWYSFNYGDVHFVSLNTETDWPGAEEEFTGDSHDKGLPAGSFGKDGEYLQWVEKDLAAAQASRKKTGWPRFIVTGGHRPYGDIKPLHTDLLAKYGVNLHVAGHGHSYSRGAPVNGTTYIMVGGAGCEEMSPPKSSNVTAGVFDMSGAPAYRQGPARQPGYAVPESSEQFASDRYATGVLNVNASGMYWRLVDSIEGTTLDEVMIA